ncbi:MAG: hypothetical protein ACO388_05730 [Saprospiraceae bacterium]
MQQLTFEYPAYFILLAGITSLVLSGVLYWRTDVFNDSPKFLKFILGTLRFFTFFFIIVLLIGPILQTTEESIEKPILAVLQDASTSIIDFTDSSELVNYRDEMDQIKERLSDKFDVQPFSFGEALTLGHEWNFDATSSNLSEGLQEIYDRYDNRNLGAIILASDGIYNQGNSPLYLQQLKEIPIHTINLGDTSANQDLAIKNILSNDIALLGDEFYLQIDIEATFLEGSSSKLIVNKWERGKEIKVFDQTIEIDVDDFFETEKVLITANTTGMQRYIVELQPIAGEKNTANNRREVFVDIIDSRKKIMVLAAAPHPDLTAIKQSILQNENYELEIHFPPTIEDINWEPVDLLILHQLPSIEHSPRNISNIIIENQLPVLYIIGAATDLNAFNQQQKVLNIQSGITGQNEVLALLNSSFNLFTLEDGWDNIIPSFPPLKTPFANFEISPNAQIWWYQMIGKVETKYPLMVFQEQDATKTGVLLGEGLWKWRLSDYLNNQAHNNFDGVLAKMIQYLSVIEDKRRLQVSLPNRIMDENQPVLLEAILYNKSFEPINTADVFLTLMNQEGKAFEFLFTPTNPNYYQLNAGILPSGDYSYSAQSTIGGETLVAEGQFSIQTIAIENYNSQANTGLMKTISNQSGGKNYTTKQLKELEEELNNSSEYLSVIYENSKTVSAIHLKWLFFLTVGFLTLEWFLRRYFGSY